MGKVLMALAAVIGTGMLIYGAFTWEIGYVLGGFFLGAGVPLGIGLVMAYDWKGDEDE